jgi:hypothetical protein
MKSRPVPFAGIRAREAAPRRSDVVRFCDLAWGCLDTCGFDGDDASRVPLTKGLADSMQAGRRSSGKIDSPEFRLSAFSLLFQSPTRE